jgi:hypothetical protein
MESNDWDRLKNIADQSGLQNGLATLLQENHKLREERRALLRALFPGDDAEELRPEDYPFEIASIDRFLEDVMDPSKRNQCHKEMAHDED